MGHFVLEEISSYFFRWIKCSDDMWRVTDLKAFAQTPGRGYRESQHFCLLSLLSVPSWKARFCPLPFPVRSRDSEWWQQKIENMPPHMHTYTHAVKLHRLELFHLHSCNENDNAFAFPLLSWNIWFVISTDVLSTNDGTCGSTPILKGNTFKKAD